MTNKVMPLSLEEIQGDLETLITTGVMTSSLKEQLGIDGSPAQEAVYQAYLQSAAALARAGQTLRERVAAGS